MPETTELAAKAAKYPGESAMVITAVVAAILAAVALAGCHSGGNKPSGKASPAPSPTATPFAIAVHVTGSDSVLFDGQGLRVAEVKAADLVASPQSGAGGALTAGIVKQGEATLYREGKPAAVFHADTLDADQKTRIVTGRGNVTLRALRPDSPAIRADTMLWRYDADKVTGSGHVVLTREPGMRLAGEQFEADTAIHKFRLFDRVHGGSSPAGTGRK